MVSLPSAVKPLFGVLKVKPEAVTEEPQDSNEEKMEKDEDQEYENCLLYFQKLHIEILKNSQVNKEPDVFP